MRFHSDFVYKAILVSRIAAQLGIRKGALYKHYKNKQGIFNRRYRCTDTKKLFSQMQTGMHRSQSIGYGRAFRITLISYQKLKAVVSVDSYNYFGLNSMSFI